MDFDSYWKDLTHRVHQEKAVLTGPEELVYRLTCIYGETMVDGVEPILNGVATSTITI